MSPDHFLRFSYDPEKKESFLYSVEQTAMTEHQSILLCSCPSSTLQSAQSVSEGGAFLFRAILSETLLVKIKGLRARWCLRR